MTADEIFFGQMRSAGCLSYILGCAREKVCVVIDPELDKAEDYVDRRKWNDDRFNHR